MSYSKRFIILNKEDANYCDSGATGYCKIEAKDDRAKIVVFVQGLRPLERGENYKVYLIKYIGNVDSVFLGSVALEKNSGEFNIEVDSNDVLGTGLKVTDFNIVAVCHQNRYDARQVECPLAGYDSIQHNAEWKRPFLKSITQSEVSVKSSDTQIQAAAQENKRKEATEQFKTADVNVSEYINYLKQGNFKKVLEIMNRARGVKEYKPFERAKLKYKWWKVTDMNFFENIFKSSVVSNQIFKHPLVKKMLRYSNYCLFGVVTDVDDKIRYIAYGFPSRYTVQDQIFVGGFANFYPAIGYTKRNGDNGYWVVHIRLGDDSIIMNV